jgi:dTDP-4-dehydrorhamnose reductase
MRIYVAGCGGMLGEAVHRVLDPDHELRCTDIRLTAPWLGHCDFRDFPAYRSSVEEFAPDLLVHLGAHTDLELCENRPDDAYRTNTLAVEHASTIAAAHGVPLVYISTAGIFDGNQTLYDDWDTPHPLGVYARSKHLGEMVVQQRVPRHFIFRAGWMMGGGPERDKKFIGKLMKQLEGRTTALDVVDDRLGTPTYTVDFVRNLREVVQTEHYGLYNMVCGGETGRLEVARELIGILRLSEAVDVRPVSSDFFAREYFAPRPASERLLNRKLELRGLNRMRDWRAALRDYVRAYWADYVRPFAPDYDPAS